MIVLRRELCEYSGQSHSAGHCSYGNYISCSMQIRDNLTLGTDAPMNIRPQNNMILRSEIAPSNLYIRENKMYLSNKQVTVLTVQQLPQNYMLDS